MWATLKPLHLSLALTGARELFALKVANSSPLLMVSRHTTTALALEESERDGESSSIPSSLAARCNKCWPKDLFSGRQKRAIELASQQTKTAKMKKRNEHRPSSGQSSPQNKASERERELLGIERAIQEELAGKVASLAGREGRKLRRERNEVEACMLMIKLGMATGRRHE